MQDRVIVVRAVSGLSEPKVFRVHKNRLVIGSVVSADIRLAAPGVAPIHAVMELMDGQITLFDLASDAGVRVNGKPVVTQVLKNGDQFQIGQVVLTFSTESVSEAQAASVPAPPVQAPARPTSIPAAPSSIQTAHGQVLFSNPQEDRAPLLLEDSRSVEEIFDYSKSSQKSLEVVMSWRGTILDVEHFSDEHEITLGQNDDSDFAIPPLLAASQFPLVVRDQSEYRIQLDPKMTGVMSRKGSLSTLGSVGATSTQQIPIGHGDFAKVRLGDIDFYLSFSQSPPRLKPRRLFERDALLLQILGTSLVMTGLLLVGAWNMTVPKAIEAETLPERLATILYQPEKYAVAPKMPVSEPRSNVALVEEPKPEQPKKPQVTKVDIKPDPKNASKPIPAEVDAANAAAAKSKGSKGAQGARAENEAKEGEGARAKGKEGTRGTKTAKNAGTPQNQAKRPSPEGGKGAGGGNSQVEGEGNVDFLAGAGNKIQDLLSSSTQRLGKGGEKLQGFGAFNTQGTGGQALSGSGSGGGGDANTTLGGLSDKGTGGGRVGTGKGAAGNGAGIAGGKARVVIRSGGPEEAVVMGSIDASAIEAALLARKNEFRYCYEQEINFQRSKTGSLPKIAGRVGTNFTIGSSGRVANAAVESSTLKNDNIENCIIRVIRSIDFPIPRGGGLVQVTYPFKFSALNEGG
jgi:outer membrane biosynthesis protein TonB